MTSREWLLIKLSEECAEIQQRVSKALTFGMTEVQEGQELDNAERIMQEVDDFIGVLSMLQAPGVLRGGLREISPEGIAAKKLKVKRFLDYAKSIKVVKG